MSLKPKKQKQNRPSSPTSVASDHDDASQQSTKAVLDGLAALQSEIRSFKAEIGDMIDQRFIQLSSSIRSELTALKNDTNNAISAMKEVASKQATTLAELERGVSFTSDQVTKLQQEVGLLTNSVSQLTDKCTDLESQSRRQNLRILNIKEGDEKGQNIRDFIAKVLQSALALDTPLMIDRAHRSTVIQSSRNNIHPRAFIIKLHYFHDWEIVMRKAAQMKTISYNQQKILIFPDLPPAIVKQRARFSRAKELLRDRPDVRYGFQYPATMRITYKDEEQRFTDPEKAATYAERLFGTGNVAATDTLE